MNGRFCAVVTLLMSFSFCITSFGNEKAEIYFPSTLGNYWIYEDQDGKEIKRTVIEGEEIAGKVYHAFNYEPELKDWINYSRFIRPELLSVRHNDITLSVKDGVQKAVKARLTKELDIFIEAEKLDSSDDDSPTVNITVKVEDDLHLLFTPITINEEWDVISFKVHLDYIERGETQGTIDYTITEVGIVLGTETVETAAGTYEDCLKVKYQTETTIKIDPNDDDLNPPGETVTTLWFAPKVGIVKLHQKSGNMFLDIIPDDADFPIVPPPPKETTLELKKFQVKAEDSATTIPSNKDEKTLEKRVQETAKNTDETYGYFPATLDSFWIYEDKDGKELKRTVIEDEEIAGKVYHAFNYEPELKDPVNYMRFINPELFYVNDQGITLNVKEGVEKAVKERLSKEVDYLFDAVFHQVEIQIQYKPTINITAEAEEDFHLLLTSIQPNEEWDVFKMKAKLEVRQGEREETTIDFTIIETGMVLGTEAVETSAGTFENCLKVKYQTETTAVFQPDESDSNPPGETVTTVWYAPNVGIVKIHQKSGNMFLDMAPKEVSGMLAIPPARETILELKKFHIKAKEVDKKENN